MPRMNRTAVALEVGEGLRGLARRLTALHEFSGSARDRELTSLDANLSAMHHRLHGLVENCRAASGSYPNYQALRKAIESAGEEAYELLLELTTCMQLGFDNPEIASTLMLLGQKIKLLRFTPGQREVTKI